LELIPENFIAYGGRLRRVARAAAERLPVVLHGVGLSIGSPDPVFELFAFKMAHDGLSVDAAAKESGADVDAVTRALGHACEAKSEL
jgi:hypothetical protein